MSGFEIFGVVAGVVGFVPLIHEVHDTLKMLAGKDRRLDKLAHGIVDTLNNHADVYQKFKTTLKDGDIAESLRRMEVLLQSMKKRCDREKDRRRSAIGRAKAVWKRRGLEEEICELQARLHEEHRTWVVAIVLRISQQTEALQRQLTEVQLVQVQNHERNHEFESKNHTHTQELVQQNTATINVILERVESLGAPASQWHRSNILPAEMVQSLQNNPPEFIIRKWAGFNTIQGLIQQSTTIINVILERVGPFAIPRVYDNLGKALAANDEHNATTLQTGSRRQAFSRQPIPPQQSSTREFNAVILGAADVGKSALILRFTQGCFVETYDPTIEESYRRHVTVDDETSMLEVMDTAGTEQFTALNEFYIKAGRGFILVFSLTNQDGLREVQNLREQIYRVKGTTHVPIVIAGTNSELTEERQVQREALMQLSAMWESPIYETSAKMDWHVSDVFEDLVRQMRLRYPVERPDKCIAM